MTVVVPDRDLAPDPAWEQPPPQHPAGAAPVLSIDGFEGPLDWLLEMAQAQQIDLGKLSILALIEAFIASLDAALAGLRGRQADLGRWGDWLVMAATLTALRSRLLLPVSPAAREEADALRQRLLDRAAIARAAAWLDRCPQLGRDVFARGGDKRLSATERHADTADLFRACLLALRVPDDRASYHPSRPPIWRVPDAAARIRAVLAERPEGALIGAFLPPLDAGAADHDLRCRAALASTLLAGLELAREGGVTIGQGIAWGDIEMRSSS